MLINVAIFSKNAYYKLNGNEIGGACGVYGGGERCARGSGGET
jgi:hypothetical protein